MKLREISLTIFTSFLAGCALLGPKYSEPQLNNPNNWSSQDAHVKVESNNITDLAWWKKFNDPQLNQLIESALSNNNNLQVAMGNLLQAQASLKQVEMNWVPTIGIGGAGFTGQSFNPGFQNTSGYPLLNNVSQNNPQNFSGYGAGFIPSYTLNVFSQIKQGEIAKLNLEMQKQTVNAVRLAVIGQVAASYFSLLGLQKQLELQNQTIADAKELRKYNLIKYQNGNVSALNIEGIDQYIAGLEAKVPDIKNNIVQAQNALQVLTNNNPGKVVTKNNFDNIATDGIIPVNLPSGVLKTRPDVVAAEYQLKVSNADIGAVTSQFFPTISLTGGLGQGSMQLSNLFNAGGDFWMGQLAATMPLLNLSLYSKIDQAKAGYYASYYNYVQTVRSAFAQVDNGLSSHDSLDQIFKSQNEALSKAQSLYTIAQKQYKVGTSSYADTVGYRLNIDYAQANLNQVKMQQMNSIVGLYQALGGGYLAESSLTQVKKFGDNHDI